MKKLYIPITITMALLVIFYAAHSVVAGKNSFSGVAETYSFQVEIDDNENVTVEVDPQFHDSQRWTRYLTRNKERGWQLLKDESYHDKWIHVQIVFTQPIPLEELHPLLQQTEFRVEKYVVAGERKNDIAAGYGPMIAYPPPLRMPRSQQEVLYDKGILILEGTTPVNDKGLGRWLQNDKVYLVDTTAVELLEFLENDLRVKPLLEKGANVSFVIHWPLSRLSWDWITTAE